MAEFYVQVKQDSRFKVVTAFGGIEITQHFPVAIQEDPEGKNREEAERHEFLEIVDKPSERASDGGDRKRTTKKATSKSRAKGEVSLRASKPDEDDSGIFDLTVEK